MSPSSGWPYPPVAAGAPSGRRVQYAALPYRVRRDGEVQIRLITSRETRRWVIPKGWPIKGLTPPKTAAREAYEEAGLVGVIAREAIGLYTYEKRLGVRSVLCDVLVFPFKVKRLLQKWPERFQRYGFWFSIETAAAAVQEEDLAALIVSFGAVMARRLEEKQRASAVSRDATRGDAAEEPVTKKARVRAKAAKAERAKGQPADGRESLLQADEPQAPGAKPGRREAIQPETERPEKAKPKAGKPDTAKPKVAKPKVAKPDTAKTKTGKSKAAKAAGGTFDAEQDARKNGAFPSPVRGTEVRAAQAAPQEAAAGGDVSNGGPNDGAEDMPAAPRKKASKASGKTS